MTSDTLPTTEELLAEGRLEFDPDGSEYLNDRTQEFLQDLAFLIEGYELETYRQVCLNLSISSTDLQKCFVQSYCRDYPEPEIDGTFVRSEESPIMVPILDTAEELMVFPPPQDDETMSKGLAENTMVNSEGRPFTVYSGNIMYDDDEDDDDSEGGGISPDTVP